MEKLEYINKNFSLTQESISKLGKITEKTGLKKSELIRAFIIYFHENIDKIEFKKGIDITFQEVMKSGGSQNE